ncbi:DUF4011 domain-containing protein [Azospirillum baldaniorum]|uniref:DNA2/NAM7 helicase helicase domain-containing protein n=1 Tax=Azospirillum baldaniorum TaxID=1064539 RepID=A0A9P1NSW9_9PROT|nr:DUF4011 domain-containing protein [Azospirillum baldaniorum]CCD03931.1 protein of unknown function [Azospirillum baldaniorum]
MESITAVNDAVDCKDTSDSGLAIDAVISPKISFATHQNAVPVLRDLRLVNLGGEALENVVAEIAADPPVFEPMQWRVDRIAAGGEARIAKRDLRLNAGLLLQLNEAVRATVTLRAAAEGGGAAGNAAERVLPVELLARNEWGGAAAMPELLAAFILPNDPAVSRLIKATSDVLRRGGRPDGVEGYQSKSRTRVHELASAVWSAVASLRLTYAEPPTSFEWQGQKVRSPSQILETGLGTCLDTALLFAAVLEQAGLYPVIVVTRGHAFAGVWLQPQEFATLLVDDAASLRKRVALQELVLFETTLATGGHPSPFSRAIAQANRQIDEEREGDFVMALDIRRARMQRLRPLALADVAPAAGTGAAAEEVDIGPVSDVLEAAPALPDFDLADPVDTATTAEGRLDRWQRKLLDLTTRNRLLNVKPGATTIRLLCPDPATLEDRLADGASFRIVAAPAMEGGAGRDTALHLQRTGEELDTAYARDAMERGEILSPLPTDKLDAQLIDLYRKAQLDLAEGGANTLFLAVGFLVWKKSGSDTRQYRAPLILLPVKLQRRSVRSGVRLSNHEDEPRFNLTLLQMLHQDFKLDIPELAGPLPVDQSGIDVPRIWTLVRRAVRDMPGFEVVEDVVLGAFSFAKYLMWKDLVDRTEALKRSPVVRHLLETPRDAYTSQTEPPHPTELDGLVTPEELFTPLPADSSQLAAVVGSARGCDFVLDGPPGTGKSQTIANMIAHNLALGRTVLFVAEKRAALDVVHRRLVAHGLGPFCLELHSNKASKQDVLGQLDAAWTTAEEPPTELWSRRAAELKLSRDRLNDLVRAIHRRHANGLTLYGAIGRVARDGAESALRLGWPRGTEHSETDLERLRDAVHKLNLHRATASPENRAAFGPVGGAEWSNAWQADLLAAAGALAAAAKALDEAPRAACRRDGHQLGWRHRRRNGRWRPARSGGGGHPGPGPGAGRRVHSGVRLHPGRRQDDRTGDVGVAARRRLSRRSGTAVPSAGPRHHQGPTPGGTRRRMGRGQRSHLAPVGAAEEGGGEAARPRRQRQSGDGFAPAAPIAGDAGRHRRIAAGAGASRLAGLGDRPGTPRPQAEGRRRVAVRRRRGGPEPGPAHRPARNPEAALHRRQRPARARWGHRSGDPALSRPPRGLRGCQGRVRAHRGDAGAHRRRRPAGRLSGHGGGHGGAGDPVERLDGVAARAALGGGAGAGRAGGGRGDRNRSPGRRGGRLRRRLRALVGGRRHRCRTAGARLQHHRASGRDRPLPRSGP